MFASLYEELYCKKTSNFVLVHPDFIARLKWWYYTVITM